MVCPACGGDACFKGYDKKTVTSLLGRIEYHRAYYHCDACHHGWHPTDEELHLTLGYVSPNQFEADHAPAKAA